MFLFRVSYVILTYIYNQRRRIMYSLDEVRKEDPEIAQAIVDEQQRQNSH